jgi:hypothetical protein
VVAHQWRSSVALGVCIIVACGGTELSTGPATDAGGAADTSPTIDATSDASSDSATTPCIPGRSVACVGPGGCSTNQVCNGDGTGYGPCDCALPEASTTEASTTTLCIPGQSVACTGPGGCVSNQVCNAAGSGYGACSCSNDGSALLCVPGQSIACSGPGGCFSSQACDSNGLAYGPCVCFGDGGSIECQTAGDCENLLGPLPVICNVCSDGGCLHWDCVLGICQTSFCG